MRVVSQKLRDSARLRDCTLRIPGVCSYAPEQTVLAHVPCGQRGVGMKGPDVVACFSCAQCHDYLDNRRGPIDWQGIIRAVAETQLIWIREGLITIEGMK